MEIVLRNGEKVNLDWNPIVLEYLEDYEGGIKQLKEDTENENYRFRAFNYIIYSILSANYSKELTYRQAVPLVNINDYEKIVDFIISNFNGLEIQDENTTRRQHRR